MKSTLAISLSVIAFLESFRMTLGDVIFAGIGVATLFSVVIVVKYGRELLCQTREETSKRSK